MAVVDLLAFAAADSRTWSFGAIEQREVVAVRVDPAAFDFVAVSE